MSLPQNKRRLSEERIGGSSPISGAWTAEAELSNYERPPPSALLSNFQRLGVSVGQQPTQQENKRLRVSPWPREDSPTCGFGSLDIDLPQDMRSSIASSPYEEHSAALLRDCEMPGRDLRGVRGAHAPGAHALVTQSPGARIASSTRPSSHALHACPRPSSSTCAVSPWRRSPSDAERLSPVSQLLLSSRPGLLQRHLAVLRHGAGSSGESSPGVSAHVPVHTVAPPPLTPVACLSAGVRLSASGAVHDAIGEAVCPRGADDAERREASPPPCLVTELLHRDGVGAPSHIRLRSPCRVSLLPHGTRRPPPVMVPAHAAELTDEEHEEAGTSALGGARYDEPSMLSAALTADHLRAHSSAATLTPVPSRRLMARRRELGRELPLALRDSGPSSSRAGLQPAPGLVDRCELDGARHVPAAVAREGVPPADGRRAEGRAEASSHGFRYVRRAASFPSMLDGIAGPPWACLDQTLGGDAGVGSPARTQPPSMGSVRAEPRPVPHMTAAPLAPPNGDEHTVLRGAPLLSATLGTPVGSPVSASRTALALTPPLPSAGASAEWPGQHDHVE